MRKRIYIYIHIYIYTMSRDRDTHISICLRFVLCMLFVGCGFNY